MDLYLTEAKLTGPQAHTLGVVQALAHSAGSAKELTHRLAHLYALSLHGAAHALQAQLRALPRRLPPSDRRQLAVDAFAQARSMQVDAGDASAPIGHVVCTASDQALTRGSLRRSVQAELAGSMPSHEDLRAQHWSEVHFTPATSHSEANGLGHLLQMLSGREIDRHRSQVPLDDGAAAIADQPLDKKLVTSYLAAQFAEVIAEQPGATPLVVLLDVHNSLTDGLHSTTNHAVRPARPHPSFAEPANSCLTLLRRANMGEIPPPLIIVHSLLGDHKGFGRLWNEALHQCDVYSVTHEGLIDSSCVSTLNEEGAMRMAGKYATAVIAAFVSVRLDFIGASFGAVLASHVVRQVASAGGRPRRLVIVDPPPAVPGELPVPKMLTSLRTAAMGVLLIQLRIEMGASVWSQFPQLQTLPVEALPCFVAAQCLPEGPSTDDLVAGTESFHKLLLVYRQCRHAFHTFAVSMEACSVESGSRSDLRSSPAVLMALSSERNATFREMFPGIKEDVVDGYGQAAKLQLPGAHIEMINRCLGNRDATFTGAVEQFLDRSFPDAWWWAAHVPDSREERGQSSLLESSMPALQIDSLIQHTLIHTAQSTTPACLSDGPSCGLVEAVAAVQHVAQDLLPNASVDAPMMEAGLDSLGAVEFRSRLSDQLGGVTLPETLIFDFPTLRQVEMHVKDAMAAAHNKMAPKGSSTALTGATQLLHVLAQQRSAPVPTLNAAPALDAAKGSAKPVAVVAASCNLGGGMCGLASTFVAGATGSDAVGMVPEHRWNDVVEGTSSFGSFMDTIQLFDNRSFGLSPAEAGLMDPHQRLALEGGYSTLHKAGFRRSMLMGSVTGVFAGIWQSDYSTVLPRRGPSSRGPLAVTATGCSMLVGRLSYLLGLQGPCIPFDTACSSSITASHAAWCGLQRRETDPALVQGVNIMCDSGLSQMFNAAHMMSPTGKSHTFDSRADGYARGEACCSAVLQLELPTSGSGGMHYEGGAVRQDGKSASLTAPNGVAQQALLRVALEHAKRAAGGAFLLEAHGTGTSLGDPIEARAINTVRDEPQLMTSVGCKVSYPSSLHVLPL